MVTMEATIDGKTYKVGEVYFISYNDRGRFPAKIHSINGCAKTVKVRWSVGTYTVYEFNEVSSLFHEEKAYNIAQVLKPVTYDEYFDDLNEIAKCVPGVARDTDELVNILTDDILFLVQDGIRFEFTCSEKTDYFELYSNFYY